MPAAAQARMAARAPTAESSGDLPPADTQTTDDHETRPAGLESPSVPESFDLDPVIWTPALLRALPHRSLAHRETRCLSAAPTSEPPPPRARSYFGVGTRSARCKRQVFNAYTLPCGIGSYIP